MMASTADVMLQFLREYFREERSMLGVNFRVDGSTIRMWQGSGSASQHACWEIPATPSRYSYGDLAEELVDDVRATVEKWNPTPWWARRSKKPTHAGKWRKFNRRAA